MDSRPIAFIDVDGVLNRLCSREQAVERGLIITQDAPSGFSLKFDLYLDPADAGRLQSLEPDFELAWGTTWQDAANDKIGSVIGLPPLSLVARSAYNHPSKWAGVVEAAAGRPFVWFEDDPYYTTRYRERIPDPEQDFLVINVDRVTGLTDEHIEVAKEWAATLDFE